MSELKAETIVPKGTTITLQMYPKSETDKVIAHQKYKRCLAMAKWCRTSARCDEGLGAFKYRDWYWKWFERWLELAELFKEAKYEQNGRFIYRWIPCSVRRPSEDDSGKSYLVTNGYEMLVCDWCGDYWENDPFCGDRNCMDITHWMELPGLPKKEEK